MNIFQYQYIDYKGKKKSGLVEAEGLAEAKEKLRAQNIIVISLTESKSQKKGLFHRNKNQLNPEQLIALTTQLSSLLSAGMPLYESLVSLDEQYRNEAFHPVIQSLCSQIKKGSSFSEALKKFPESFSALYCSMIAAGESVGLLESSLQKLAELISKQRKLKKQLIAALIYPFLLFIFSGFINLVFVKISNFVEHRRSITSFLTNC